jgi:hypothetical protein
LLSPKKLNASDSYLVVAHRERTQREENRKRFAKQHRNNAAGKVLEHDPEKWTPVFRKRSCSNKKMADEHDSTQLKHALAARLCRRHRIRRDAG